MTATAETRKLVWAKCRVPTCLHIWPIMYAPMDLTAAARLMRSPCPMCGDKKPVLAKQNDGVLQEEDRKPARGKVAVTLSAQASGSEPA